VESANVAYGSLVVDFHDFKVLDLDTLVWLPVSCSYPRCRGGIHAIVETKRGWLLSGGAACAVCCVVRAVRSLLSVVDLGLVWF
jgi:hypothetical protein